jgi:hypothetical protein
VPEESRGSTGIAVGLFVLSVPWGASWFCHGKFVVHASACLIIHGKLKFELQTTLPRHQHKVAPVPCVLSAGYSLPAPVSCGSKGLVGFAFRMIMAIIPGMFHFANPEESLSCRIGIVMPFPWPLQ